MPKRLALYLILATFLSLTVARSAFAHGVVWREDPSDKTISLSFMYTDQSPMKYSKVQLFSPQDAEVPYQSSVTDKNGGFAFMPDAPGLWKFSSNDGQGHMVSGELEVAFPEAPAPGGQAGPAPAPAPPLASGGSKSPTWEKIGLGLSLIVNVFFIAIFLRRKPKVKQTA
ncbi:MAG: hypothetical protein LBF58_10950 [Deltaproteobacteria bacterium]|jgi:nickel transport protein|nr:hypothetical protein [Deltaproteobacteria bacterium]